MATVIEVMAKLTGNASGMIATFNQARAAAKETANEIGITGEQAAASFEKMVVPAAVIGAATVAAGAHFAVMASEAEQNIGAVESVFKQYAETVKATSASAAENVGISTSSYQQFASIVGSQLKNMGVPLSDVASGTDDLIKKGADLASMFGGTTSEAIEAISSMLRGETDPIERYGVSINQAAVEAKMLAMGLTGLEGPAEKNAQLQAKLAILTEQTADATGNFAREGDTAAGAMQRATAKWENAQSVLGTALLPAMTAVAGGLAGMATFVSENSELVLVLGGILGGLAGTILLVAGALKLYAMWTELATVATYLFGTAQKAAMAGTIIGIILLIVGAFAYLWMTSEDFRNFWIGMWNQIVEATRPFVDGVTSAINTVVDVFKLFFGYLSGAGAETNLPSGVQDWVRGMADAVLGIWGTITGFFDAVGQAATDLTNILFRGDFTGLLGLEEDSGIVSFLMGVHDTAEDLYNLLFRGDFTGLLGLEEDSPAVAFLLGLRTAGEDLANLLFRGDFTGLFGLEEDSGLVTFLLDLHGAAESVFGILTRGDFTGPIFGLEEDSGFVGFLLGIRTAAEDIWNIFARGDFTGLFGLEEDSAIVDFLFDVKEAAEGVFSILTGGGFTGPIFGMEEDSSFVDSLFKIREGAEAAMKWIGDLIGTVTGFYASLSSGVATDIFSFITESNVGAWLADLWGKAQPILGQLGEAWAKVWEFISNAFMTIGPPLMAYVVAIFTTLWDILTGVWNAVGEPLMAIIVAGWNIVVDGLKAAWNIIMGVVTGAMDIIAGVIAVVTGIITGNWTQVWEGLGQIFGGIWKIITTIVGEALGFIGSILSNGLDIIVNIWNGVWGAIGAILGAVFSNIGNLIGTWLGLIGGVMSAIFGGIWDNITGFFGGIFGWLGDLWNGFIGFFSDIWSGLAGGASEGAAAVSSPIVDAFNGLVGFVSGIFNGIRDFIVGVWTWVFNLLTSIGAAFWAEHGAQLTAGWNFIVAIFTAIQTGISSAWSAIWNAVVGYVTGIWNTIVSIFTAVWTFIVEIFTTIWNFYVSIWTAIFNAVATAANAIWSVISSVFTTVWGFISGIFNTIAGFIAGVWNGIINTIRSVVNAIVGTISGWASSIWGTISSVFNRVAGFLGGIWSNILSGVSSTVGQIGGFFSGIWGTVTGALSGAGTWLLNAGKQVVQGFISGVQSLAGTIGNAFLSMVPGWIVGPFKAALGIASPSKLFRQFGRWIIQGLGIGVDDQRGTAVGAVENVARAVENAGSNMVIAAPTFEAPSVPTYEAPKISLPEVPDIAAQLALPTLTQDVMLNFIGTSPLEAIKNFDAALKAERGATEGGQSYNAIALGGGTVAQQQAPVIEVNMTALIENPFGEGYLEAKIKTISEDTAAGALSGTARVTRNSRSNGVGGF